MRRSILYLPLVAAASFGQDLVLRHASVFDPAAAGIAPDRTIVIRNGRIAAVAPPGARVARPRHARTLDLRGKYVIPGLIDAHVHLVHQPDFAHMTPEEVLPMYLAWGVTSVRSAGEEIVAAKLAQRWADKHSGHYPRVYLCSPLLDTNPPYHADIGKPVTDPAKVPEIVSDLEQWGIKTLKIYVGTEREIGRRIIAEGHARGLTVAAHLGKYTAQDAVADGVDVLEHIWSVFNYSFAPGAPRPPRHEIDLANGSAAALRSLIAEKRTIVDPTLVVFRNMILLNDLPEIHNHPDHARVPRRLRDHWDRYRARANLNPETRPTRRAEFGKYQELTGLLHRAGIPILAGTDSPEPYVTPGASLHQELELLVQSGLSPAEALTAATRNNARALREEGNTGCASAGCIADLVVLSANPLDDIRNTRKIDWVIQAGKPLRPSAILSALPAE